MGTVVVAKYRLLADGMVADIERGRLKAGDRLMSLRDFSRAQAVSMSTAVNTYEELERLGWIQARPQSGFYITDQRSLTNEPTWPNFKAKVIAPKSANFDMRINDGPLGASSLELPESVHKHIARSMRRAAQQSLAQLQRYPHRQGEPQLRQALAAHFSQIGFAQHADELVITNGCISAVRMALMASTQAGDVVAVSSPCFDELLMLLATLHLKVVEIPTTDAGVDLDQFESLLSQGCVQAGLFSTTHMNPQGISMSVEQKKRLCQLAAAYKIPIVEDDVYFELTHGSASSTSTSYLPASYYDQSGYLIWCGSVSKSLSPSLRIGWCRPARFFESTIKLAQGEPVYPQLVLSDLLRSGSYARHIKQTAFQLTTQVQQYRHYLAERLPPGSLISKPTGGLVLWLQVPKLNAKQLMLRAVQEQLDIRIGSAFTATNRYQNCVRINVGFEFNDTVTALLDLLLSLIDEQFN